MTATDIALILGGGLIYLPILTYLVCKLGRAGYLMGEARFSQMFDRVLPPKEYEDGKS